MAATCLGIGMTLVYWLGISLATHRIFFWVTTPIFYALIFWINISLVGPFSLSFGLIVSTLVAIAGAGYSSLQEEPKPEEVKAE